MGDITTLYQIRLPDKAYIETYDMRELERLLSQFLVGHRIDKILAKFNHFHYAESLDDVDEEMIDADNWLGFDVLLKLDHGYLELSPWEDETIKLRFFKKEELEFTEELKENKYDKEVTYYATKGPVTDVILHHTIRKITADNWVSPQLLFFFENSKAVAFVTDEGEDCCFAVRE